MKAIVRFLLQFVCAVGLLFSVQKMASIAQPYLIAPYPTDIDFLLNKQAEVRINYWLWAFYLHISSSVLALAAGAFQFSKTLLHEYPTLHRNLGKIYLFMVLFISAPTGLVMGIHGIGGILGQTAFVLQASIWWWAAYKAYTSIRAKNIRLHSVWALRGYAMALSAISLRGMSYLAETLKVWQGWECPDTFWWLCHPNLYIFQAWASWIFNLLVAEGLIWWGFLDWLMRKE